MELDILTVAAIGLALSFVLSEVFFRLRYPRVLGQLLAGIILGIPMVKALYTPRVLTDISFLADLGIIFLLLLTGLQLNLEKFKRTGKDTVLIALSCVIVPFGLGFLLMKAVGYSTLVAFVVGAAFSLTAEGTKLKVLLDMKALNTKVGVVMLGAGILDDVFEIIFLSVILVLTQRSFESVAYLPVKMLMFVAIVYLLYKLFPFLLALVRKEHSRVAMFSFILIFALLFAVISDQLGLGPIIGALIAGIIIHLSEHRKYEHKENIKELEVMTFAFIIPFFFINIGLHFDLSTLVVNPWLTGMVLVTATAGKLLGALIMTPFTKLTLRQTHLIGWGMNSRGAIELVIAEIARSAGLIPTEVYSAVVFMALVTTFLFPVVLKLIISRDRTILHHEPEPLAKRTRS